MAGAVSPDVQPMRNVLLAHELGQAFIFVPAHVVLAGGQHEFVFAITLKVPGVPHVPEEVRRAIEVAVVIVVAVEELRDVECSAHAEAGTHHVRPTQRQVHGVVSAERAPGGGHVPARVLLLHQRHYLVQDVVLILHVPGDPPAWRYIAVVPTLGIDAIDAIKLQSPGFDLVPKRADHAAIFKLEESALGGRKNDRRQASMTEDQQLHVPPESRRPPLVIFASHDDWKFFDLLIWCLAMNRKCRIFLSVQLVWWPVL